MTDQPNMPQDPNAGQQPPVPPPTPPVPPAQPPTPPAQPPSPPAQPPTPPAGQAPPPPPPPGAYPPPPVGPDGTAGGAVNADVGSAFSWAMNKFGKYAAVLIGLAAVVFLIRLVGALVQKAILNALVGTCDTTVVVAGQAITTSGTCVASLAQSITASLIVSIIFGVLAWIATIGIYRAALKTTRGETPGFHNLTTGENLGKYIVVAIVYGLLIGVGLILCILPGIIFAFLFQLAPFYALDKGQGVSEALGNSYRATTQNFVPALLMTLINIVAAFVGSILFGVLTLVALPFAALFTAHMYRQFNREQIAA